MYVCMYVCMYYLHMNFAQMRQCNMICMYCTDDTTSPTYKHNMKNTLYTTCIHTYSTLIMAW